MPSKKKNNILLGPLFTAVQLFKCEKWTKEMHELFLEGTKVYVHKQFDCRISQCHLLAGTGDSLDSDLLECTGTLSRPVSLSGEPHMLMYAGVAVLQLRALLRNLLQILGARQRP